MPRIKVRQPRRIIIARGVTMLAFPKTQEVGFFRIPKELWAMLPGTVTMALGDGTRIKTMKRGKRTVTFYSKPSGA